MPTERKTKIVAELREWMERCTVAIATDYSGVSVTAMTGLRRALREQGVQYRVVKNTLAHLAADAAGQTAMKGIVEGPTGIAFGYGDPTEPAKALAEFIRTNRTTLTVKGGVMGERTLTAQEVSQLAALPSRDELLARLAGQLQSPIAGLVHVLNGPLSGLARVLQRRIESVQEA